MSNIENRGIFKLKEVSQLQISNNWADSNIPIGNIFGYFIGGGSGLTLVDRIDYANDLLTSSPRGPLSIIRSASASVSNSNYSYTAGGLTPTIASSTDRIDYSNDTAVSMIRGPLTSNRQYLTTVGNQNFGYFAGGSIPPATSVVTVDRIDYSNDLFTASPRGSLTLARQQLSAAGNQNYGWFGGGSAPVSGAPVYTTVDRVDYTNDIATSSPRGPLNVARGSLAATGNTTFGYFAGGHPGPFTTVDRVNYINDTVVTTGRTSLNFTRSLLGATGSSSFGYFAGGSPSSLVERIDYSNDYTYPLIRGSFSPRSNLSATSPHENASLISEIKGLVSSIPLHYTNNFGYFGGGGATPGTPTYSTIDRIDYSNDTATASPRGPLSVARINLSATGDTFFGYFGGGGPSATNRVDYSNDTAVTSIRGSLDTSRSFLAATGNSSFGYFGGGSPGERSTVDRIDYANDTDTTLERGNLGSSRKELSATGNSNFGYFGGGTFDQPMPIGGPLIYSIIERIDYSNDTATASPRGPLTAGKYYSAATGNSNFAYFAGGLTPAAISTIERIDYSNDTATASPRGLLTRNKWSLSATGNSNFGYFGGGNVFATPAPVAISDFDRVDYSNDTVTSFARGKLSFARAQMGACSGGANGLPQNQTLSRIIPSPITSFAYFGGGSPTGTAVDRVDYSNDLATTLLRGPLSQSRYYLTATSSLDYGYFCGGFVPSEVTTIDRVDYANDTFTASIRASMPSVGRRSLAATGNVNFGYIGGGFTPAAPLVFSTVNRINYANDMSAPVVRSPLSLARQELSATGNSNFGYFAGGITPAPSIISTIDRIDYSNDGTVALVRGTLLVPRHQLSATGNSEFGYFGGGLLPSPSTIYSIIDRIDYSNDTVIASQRGSLYTPNRLNAATGNSSFGYFGGGITPGVTSAVERIDYSNDTTVASRRGQLSISRGYLAATSATSNGLPQPLVSFPPVVGTFTDFGYFGFGPINRIEYSNDTVSAIPRGSLTLNRQGLAATGNSNFGYFSSGATYPAGSPVYSIIDRIDYSNDNVTASARSVSNDSRNLIAATGNSNFGYFVGGTPGIKSTVERVNYSNDMALHLNRGSLNNAKYALSATGNSNFGYIGGGQTPTVLSIIERINYSNDIPSPLLRSPLNVARYFLSATGNSNFGYFGGGLTPAIVSTIERIDYANDTLTTSPRGPLSTEKYGMAATGNSNFGYFSAGFISATPANLSTSSTDRVEYSNDTVTTSPRGSLRFSSFYNAASSAAANGLPQ